MEYNVRDDAMRLVVKYLNLKGQINASLTCRSWKTIIDEETKIKGPKIVTQEIIISRYNRAVAKNEHVFVSTDIRPCLLLCFTNKDCNSVIAERHVVQQRPNHCILVELKRNLLEDVNTVWTILLPSSRNLRIDTLNFVTKCRMPIPTYRWIDFMGGGRLIYYPEYFRQLGELSHWYDTMIFRTLYRKLGLVLFCTYSDIPDLKDIIKQLSYWHPLVGPIWGCTLNSAEVCRNTLNKGPKSIQANCVQIYLSGKDMLTHLLVLNEHCNTKEKIQKKFHDLKRITHLRKYSIAFMCTSVTRFHDFYEIESAAFKRIFPQVTLAHIFSRRPFGARNFYEFNKYLENIKPHIGNNVTTFLLITYN